MKVVIVDLEATCQRERNPDFISEIIEIGAVKIENDTVVEEMSLFVKPTINPILTDFCTELTSITQEDVDNFLSGKTYEEVNEFSEFYITIGQELCCEEDKVYILKKKTLSNLLVIGEGTI